MGVGGCVYVCVRASVRMRVCVLPLPSVCERVCVHVCMCVHVCVASPQCVCVCACVCGLSPVCVCVCMCVLPLPSVYVCACVCARACVCVASPQNVLPPFPNLKTEINPDIQLLPTLAYVSLCFSFF